MEEVGLPPSGWYQCPQSSLAGYMFEREECGCFEYVIIIVINIALYVCFILSGY